jgi:UDP-N-acetylmuramyl pentapeptide phosphotransferase/UDP-N-acetylglucosamine-1-phosphate transferase
LAISFVIFNDGFIIDSLNGFLNINEIPYYLYLVIAGFMMLTIINAYNLIDGIDGLASVVGIVILMIYTTIFYITKEYFFTLLCISLNASLIAFFGFNISTKRKIFMGDTGSMIVGFIISILTLKFLALPAPSYDALPFLLENVPLIAISILIVPLFDTARVFTIRLANKKSPFSPDRNHMHHVLIDYMGLTHQQASLIIGGFNLMFVVLFIVLGSASYNLYLVIALIVTAITLSYILYRFDYSFKNFKRRLTLRKKASQLRLIKDPKPKKKKEKK